MKKQTIAILFGGCSPEYHVSLQSAHSVCAHLDTSRYDPLLVGISEKGQWFRFDGEIGKIAADTWCNDKDCRPAVISPDRGAQTLLVLHPGTVERIRMDAAFPLLHGKNGEDGTVQGLIELAGIPLIGCGTMASSLCMDKHRAHQLASAAGVEIPASFSLNHMKNAGDVLLQANRLGYPLFVKPVRAGSSFGITKVFAPQELPTAIESAFQFDGEVILEENIQGFEVGCAVLGNENPIVGEIDEIELSQGFFDFNEKYTLKTSHIHVPARVPVEKAEEIKRIARTLYRVLGCSGFARVDMFLREDGVVVFNEVNTIPGFTEHSRYPGMMKAVGLSFPQLITGLIEQAVGT